MSAYPSEPVNIEMKQKDQGKDVPLAPAATKATSADPAPTPTVADATSASLDQEAPMAEPSVAVMMRADFMVEDGLRREFRSRKRFYLTGTVPIVSLNSNLSAEISVYI